MCLCIVRYGSEGVRIGEVLFTTTFYEWQGRDGMLSHEGQGESGLGVPPNRGMDVNRPNQVVFAVPSPFEDLSSQGSQLSH